MKGNSQNIIVGKKELLHLIDEWRLAGETVVFTNGVFDILHRGHLQSLEQAAALGDKLIVAVNSDHSARLLEKGRGRPFNNENDRAALIAGLVVVDAVTIFDEPTPEELLELVRPDVLVKGQDYRAEDIAGRQLAGRVERLPLMEGYSTSSLINRILMTKTNQGDV